MKFYSEDGKLFTNQEECAAHERKLAEEKKAKEAKRAEKEAALKEITDLFDKLEEKIKEYEKIYGAHSNPYRPSDLAIALANMWYLL